MNTLYESLTNTKTIKRVPFHMPGHKRDTDAFQDNMTALKAASLMDFTELPETDDLHHAHSIIKEAEKRAAVLYNADETHFLTGGSTSGILAAVSAVTRPGDTIICARNSHRSFYHALYLNRLKPVYLLPEETSYPITYKDKQGKGKEIITSGTGETKTADCLPFSGIISADSVKSALEENPSASAVFLTCPTYEGVISQIRPVAELAHSHGIPLIVDAAHGAHLGLSPLLPESALSQGADISICSVHKTLSAFTQGALINVNGNFIDMKRIRRFLQLYQSSSPSYILMSSIDAALSDIAVNGEERFKALVNNKRRILSETVSLKNLRILPEKIISDPCKVTVLCPPCNSGNVLAERLRNQHNIEPELACGTHVVFLLSPYDRPENILRLTEALCTEDKFISEKNADCKAGFIGYGSSAADSASFFMKNTPRQALSIAEAWDSSSEPVTLAESAGRISTDFIYAYPPGIPLITPGEVLSAEIVKNLITLSQSGFDLYGITDDGQVTCHDSKYRKHAVTIHRSERP